MKKDELKRQKEVKRTMELDLLKQGQNQLAESKSSPPSGNADN